MRLFSDCRNVLLWKLRICHCWLPDHFSIDSLSGERIHILQHTNHISESMVPIMKQFLEAIPVLPETIQLATVISRFFSRMFAVEFRTTNSFVYQDLSQVKNFTPDESYAASITERYKQKTCFLPQSRQEIYRKR